MLLDVQWKMTVVSVHITYQVHSITSRMHYLDSISGVNGKASSRTSMLASHTYCPHVSCHLLVMPSCLSCGKRDSVDGPTLSRREGIRINWTYSMSFYHFCNPAWISLIATIAGPKPCQYILYYDQLTFKPRYNILTYDKSLPLSKSSALVFQLNYSAAKCLMD